MWRAECSVRPFNGAVRLIDLALSHTYVYVNGWTGTSVLGMSVIQWKLARGMIVWYVELVWQLFHAVQWHTTWYVRCCMVDKHLWLSMERVRSFVVLTDTVLDAVTQFTRSFWSKFTIRHGYVFRRAQFMRICVFVDAINFACVSQSCISSCTLDHIIVWGLGDCHISACSD